MYYHHSWVDTLSALLVPVVAIGAVIIGGLQWWTARNKLKLELFDKRFAVFDAARRFLASILRAGAVGDSELSEFMVKTREAKWLFDDEVEKYLHEELYRKAIAMMTYHAELEGLPVGAERTAKVHQESEILQWMTGQWSVMDKLFSPFLRLKH